MSKRNEHHTPALPSLWQLEAQRLPARVALIGVISPSLTGLRTSAAASESSDALCIDDSANEIALSLGAEAILSIQSLGSIPSPSKAYFWTAVSLSASAWLSRRL